jgi:hypothetical protein
MRTIEPILFVTAPMNQNVALLQVSVLNTVDTGHEDMIVSLLFCVLLKVLYGIQIIIPRPHAFVGMYIGLNYIINCKD